MKGTLVWCDVCDFHYVRGIAADERQHARLHEAALAARGDFAAANPDLPELPLSYAAREALKHGGVNHVLAHFARSWEASGYSSRHPSFERYARGMTVSAHMRSVYGADVVKRYPPKLLPGLEPGKSYWRPARRPAW
jgi:hypothetical protein